MKILVVQIGHYGDLVLLTPVFQALRQSYPDAEIHLLAARRNHALLRSFPMIDKHWVYDKHPMALTKLLLSLRRERFDWHIDPKDHFSRESSLLASLIGAKKCVGYNAPGKHTFTHSVQDAKDNNRQHLHCVIRNLQALAPLNIEVPELPPRPILFPAEDSLRFVDEFYHHSFVHHENTLLVLNLSAGDISRYWRESSWSAVIEHFAVRPVNIVCNALPTDQPLAQRLAGAHTTVKVFPSRSVLDAVALVQRATFVVTPDTAIIHIAAAFNVPCVALFNKLAWNADKFCPLSSLNEVLLPPEGFDTLTDITPEEVCLALHRIGCE